MADISFPGVNFNENIDVLVQERCSSSALAM